jgi:D-alanyl-D-alanine carboxypeptidase
MKEERESKEKRVYKKLVHCGQKNWLCFVFMVPVLFLTHLFFYIISYFENNKKRLAILPMICFISAAFSSFSFPIFAHEDGMTQRLADMSELTVIPTVALVSPDTPSTSDAFETEDLSLEESYFEQDLHGAEDADRYNVDEILAYNADLIDNEADQAPESETNSEDASPSFSKDDWRLVLINKQHPIPDDYSFTLATIKGSSQCDERILKDLLNMLKAAKEDGINLVVRSPYRTEDRQTVLFNQKIKNYMRRGMSYIDAFKVSSQTVTVPGSSEHEVGLALDITCDSYPSLDAGFGDTVEGKWLAANGQDFGFILRYPLGKEYITGIEYEPWHFRYVGSDAAHVMADEGITLEEFWERL